MRSLLFSTALGVTALGLLAEVPPAAHGSSPADGRAAMISLRVPADAEIWFDGVPTTQTGSVRQFISPPLEPGRYFTYQLRVRWTDDGRPVERTRRLTVYGGERIDIGSYGPNSGETRNFFYDPDSPGPNGAGGNSASPSPRPAAARSSGESSRSNSEESAGPRYHERSEPLSGPPGQHHSTYSP